MFQSLIASQKVQIETISNLSTIINMIKIRTNICHDFDYIELHINKFETVLMLPERIFCCFSN